jgi:outer membrane protein TolC
LSDAIASGKKAVAIADGLFAMGLTDFLHVLQSRRSLYQSQDQFVQSRQKVAMDLVVIFKAMGGGWQGVQPSGQAAADTGQSNINSAKTHRQ